VAARGSGGRQPSAAHGDHFTPLRVSHDPGPGHSRFASRTIQVYILLFPFLVLCLITWPLCHDLSGRPLGSSLSGPDLCLVNGELSLTLGCRFLSGSVRAFSFLPLQSTLFVGSDRYSLTPIRALQVQPKHFPTFTLLVQYSSERSRKLQSVP
jgi:hypothetical protein